MTTKYEFTYIIQGSRIAMQIIDYSDIMPKYYSCVKRTVDKKDLIKELHSKTPKIEYISKNNNIINIFINNIYNVVLDINKTNVKDIPKQYENSSYAIKYILQDHSSLYVQAIHKFSSKCYQTYIYTPDEDKDGILNALNNFPRISEDEDRILINVDSGVELVLRPLKSNSSGAKSLKKWYEHTIKENIEEEISDMVDIAFDYNS
jgi:hypothetical protein